MSMLSPSPSPIPSPLPPSIAKPVRKLSNAAATAISAGQSAFHALTSQVGGHPGVLASEDNTLIVKKSLHNERTFYELVARGHEEVEKLGRWLPRFYGVLRLEGKVKTNAIEEEVGGLEHAGGVARVSAEAGLEQGIEPVSELEDKDKFLENVSSIFTKPNIMDIKLGTVLYEVGESEEKKQHMIEAARETTSLETGIRLTGFQVFDYTANAPVITPKSYGRSIKAPDLPDGMRRFFPLSSSTTPQGQGLPRDLLLPIMKGLLNDIRTIREALATTELRMVGGSLLIVYEADWKVAREALDAKASAAQTNSAGVEAADVNEEDIGYDSDIESEEEEAPAYTVKLIDFAHTRLTPGLGPDEGVLKGVDTTISLFEGRIKELESEV